MVVGYAPLSSLEDLFRLLPPPQRRGGPLRPRRNRHNARHDLPHILCFPPRGVFGSEEPTTPHRGGNGL